jgi:hypothetical protein
MVSYNNMVTNDGEWDTIYGMFISGLYLGPPKLENRAILWQFNGHTTILIPFPHIRLEEQPQTKP